MRISTEYSFFEPLHKTGYECGHKHACPYLDRGRDSRTYDMYIEWKYSVGSKGTKELCWECYYQQQKKQK